MNSSNAVKSSIATATPVQTKMPLQETNLNGHCGSQQSHDSQALSSTDTKSRPSNKRASQENSTPLDVLAAKVDQLAPKKFQKLGEEQRVLKAAAKPVDVKDLGNFDEAVPVHTGKLQEAFYNYLFDQLSPQEMSTVKKFVLVPIGLPGMGKTTLSRFLHHTCQSPITYAQTEGKSKNLAVTATNKLMKRTLSAQDQQTLKLDFKKISYDDILGVNQREYCAKNPDVDMHAAIDIIRDKADQDYLTAIATQCGNTIDENSQDTCMMRKELIYLDRNNTPDVWKNISQTIDSVNQSRSDFKTILMVPQQHIDFNACTSYKWKNPICPQMIFECIKRIFGRKNHDCLSAANKPKVVEVILKFARLYDGCDFNDEQQLRKYFDDYLMLDFLEFNDRPNLDQLTLKTITNCFNETPPNFQVPADDVIQSCIEAVDAQIALDAMHNGPTEAANLLLNHN